MPTAKWAMKSLGDVAARVPYSIVDGPFGSNMKASDYVESGVPVLQGKNITNDSFRWVDIRYLSEKKAIELKRSSVRVDDILLVKIGSIGYAAVIDSLSGHDYAIIPANLAKITPNKELIDTRYLFRWLTSPDSKRYFQSNASKTAQPALSLAKIKALPILVPSLSEQRRISTILDQVDALRVMRRAALAHLASLKQSIFVEMFGDPVANPFGYETKRLGDVADFYGGNSLPNSVPFTTQRDGFFVMKVSDMNLIGNERTIETCQSWSPVAGSRSGTCPSGSIIIPKRGGAIGTNKKRIATRATILDPNLMAISPDITFVQREYLFQWFLRFDLASITSGSSVPQLNKQDLVPLLIQVPPLGIQEAFAARICAVDALEANNQTALRQLDMLFASLQYSAFRGEM